MPDKPIVHVPDIPSNLPIKPEAAARAAQILALVDSLTWYEVATTMGAVLVSLGIADGYQSGELPPSDGAAFVEEIRARLIGHAPHAVWSVPGAILLSLPQLAKQIAEQDAGEGGEADG